MASSKSETLLINSLLEKLYMHMALFIPCMQWMKQNAHKFQDSFNFQDLYKIFYRKVLM